MTLNTPIDTLKDKSETLRETVKCALVRYNTPNGTPEDKAIALLCKQIKELKLTLAELNKRVKAKSETEVPLYKTKPWYMT